MLLRIFCRPAGCCAALCVVLACGPPANQSEIPRRSPGAPAVARGGAEGTAGTGGAGGMSAPPGTDGAMAAGAEPLPLSVTAKFPNQGWFADPMLEKSFVPGATVLRQVDATTGPCAARPAPARGRCLKISFTPPASTGVDAGAGWVGIFMLSTIQREHPEANPAVKIGDPNWGLFADEPGVNIAPGATRISFDAAAEVAGQVVEFKAGVDNDSFQVPKQVETLGTAWKRYAISLAGIAYGNNVYGGFAWALTDTSKPVTFYLDNVVWE